jgi:2-polyprenyl-6-methoxyphenol hydroxylase-like FAD-dependent oxidoreductase
MGINIMHLWGQVRRQGVIDAMIPRARTEVHPRLADLVEATPNPFLQTIADVIVPKTVFGRIYLLGDAAFVVRPHTAGSAAKAAHDATSLADALKRARSQIDAGLAAFEERQLEYGRDMSEYGIALGRRFASAK